MRCGKTCEDENKVRNVKNNHYSTRLQRKKSEKKDETPLSEVSYNLIPAPMINDGEDEYIFDC